MDVAVSLCWCCSAAYLAGNKENKTVKHFSPRLDRNGTLCGWKIKNRQKRNLISFNLPDHVNTWRATSQNWRELLVEDVSRRLKHQGQELELLPTVAGPLPNQKKKRKAIGILECDCFISMTCGKRDQTKANGSNCKQFHSSYIHLLQSDLWQEPRAVSASLWWPRVYGGWEERLSEIEKVYLREKIHVSNAVMEYN